MKERGESIRDIARMAGIGAKTVRELIRSASADEVAAEEPAGAAAAVLNGHDGAHAEPRGPESVSAAVRADTGP
jgi:transposase